jgi:hypothetical protein
MLDQLITQLSSGLIRFGTALAVIIIGSFLAKTATNVVQKLLAKIGVDGIADKLNEIDFVQKFNFKIELSKTIAKTLYYLIMLICITVAAEILAMPAISALITDIINYFPLLISAGIVLIVGTMLADFLKSIVATTCASLGIASGKIIANIVFYFIFLNVIVSALSQAKIDTDFIKNNFTVLIGSFAGAFALGYGLASKDMMSSILASFFHRDRFDIGDIITIEGVTGEIVEMDNTSIILQTDGKRVIIPSSKLHSEKIELHDNKMLH